MRRRKGKNKEEFSIGQTVWVRGVKGVIAHICGLDIFVKLNDGRGMFFPKCAVNINPPPKESK